MCYINYIAIFMNTGGLIRLVFWRQPEVTTKLALIAIFYPKY